MYRKQIPQTRVFQKWSKWWFWDKNGIMDGPYNTRKDAELSLVLYCRRYKINETTKARIKQLYSNKTKRCKTTSKCRPS